MATHSSHLTQDENFSVHFDGVKTNGSSVQKHRGGLGGRKALYDISNSAALKASRKYNTKNAILIGDDLGVSKKAQIPVGGKAQVSGRKALGDLTNSVKPFSQQQQQQGLKKKKSIAVAEDEIENLPYSIAQEGFLHNHEECVKSQKTAMDLHHFLKTIGLDEDFSCQSCNPLPRKSKDEDPIMLFGMEEIPMPIIEDRPCGQSSPICGSPNSPRLPYSMKDCDIFILAETPLQSKDTELVKKLEVAA